MFPDEPVPQLAGAHPNTHSKHLRAFADEPLNRLYEAIRQLSELDRAVILLYLDEKSYSEIGEIIGTNPNNVGVRINRIKDRLRRILDAKDNRSDVA